MNSGSIKCSIHVLSYAIHNLPFIFVSPCDNIARELLIGITLGESVDYLNSKLITMSKHIVRMRENKE